MLFYFILFFASKQVCGETKGKALWKTEYRVDYVQSLQKDIRRKDPLYPLHPSPGKRLDYSVEVNVFAGSKGKVLEGGHKLETKRPDLGRYRWQQGIGIEGYAELYW